LSKHLHLSDFLMPVSKVWLTPSKDWEIRRVRIHERKKLDGESVNVFYLVGDHGKCWQRDFPLHSILIVDVVFYE
jgi:hypothetical protein